MPIEQVRCNNCGSGDVHQLAPDSYRCEHCHTGFRWVDPTKITVAHNITVSHNRDLCSCGMKSVGFCSRCREPFCKRHFAYGSTAYRLLLYRWASTANPWGATKEQLIGLFYRMVILDDWPRPLGPAIEEWEEWPLPDSLRQMLDDHRIPRDIEAILCGNCKAECDRGVESVEELLRQRVERGQACEICWSDHVAGRCGICGKGVCTDHGTVCERCHQQACRTHVVEGRLCTRCSSPAEKPAVKGARCARILVAAVLRSFFCQFDSRLRQWLDAEDSHILYRFAQIMLYAVLPLGVTVLIVTKIAVWLRL